MAGLLDDLGGYTQDLMSDMGGYSPWQSGTTGNMTAYHPSWRDQLSAWLMGDKRPSLEQSRFAEGLTGSRGFGVTQPGVLDATPAGLAFAGNEAYRDPTPDNVMAALPFMPGAKGVRAPAPAGIRAYHGSPHDFDKFSLDKIGTGEGAQAYGHGLYFAENEGVAKSYRDNLSKPEMDWSLPSFSADARSFMKNVEKQYGKYLDEADLDAIVRNARHQENEIGLDLALDEIQNAVQHGGIRFNQPKGSMYEVRINADPEHFLDWDKPLLQQSEKVRAAVTQALPEHQRTRNLDLTEKLVKGGILDGPTVTQKLRDAGVPGIKYLDQGSRSSAMLNVEPHEFFDGSKGWRVNGPKGDVTFASHKEAQDYVKSLDAGTTRNYVVFDDKIIDILRKYGIAGTMVAGVGMAVSSSDVEAHPALIPLLMGVGAFAGGLSNDADRAELMLNRQSQRLYDYAPQPGMLDLMGPR